MLSNDILARAGFRPDLHPKFPLIIISEKIGTEAFRDDRDLAQVVSPSLLLL